LFWVKRVEIIIVEDVNAVYLYHFPFVAGVLFWLVNPQSNVGTVPVSLVNAGADVVVFTKTSKAALQLPWANEAETAKIKIKNTKDFFMAII
jgi:hypothetical protein